MNLYFLNTLTPKFIQDILIIFKTLRYSRIYSSLEDSPKKAKQLSWYLALDKLNWKCCWEYIQDQFIKKTIFIVIENLQES